MRKIIHQVKKIREQPEEIRTHILHLTTIIFGVILAMLWVYSLGTNIAESNVKTKKADELKPFSILKDSIVDGYQSISDN